ncbi:MAG: nucleotide pyrophosphohydrolase [Candidatus Lokiarchaeota archaeon]|nr:nucleotide pyrophosphohydrolase [Candidatus Lokiarchaeota archaeon]
MNLFELQNLVDEWVKGNGGYWAPLAMLASATEELGEVAREINNLEQIKKKKKGEKKKDLGIELADMIFSVICLANHYQINLSEAFDITMKKYTNRDWERFLDDEEEF